MTKETQTPFEYLPRLPLGAGRVPLGGKGVLRKCHFDAPLGAGMKFPALCDFRTLAQIWKLDALTGAQTAGGFYAPATQAHAPSAEAAKKTVRDLNAVRPELEERRRKASPKAVALLERWKDLPSVDPHLLRADNERLLDSSL